MTESDVVFTYTSGLSCLNLGDPAHKEESHGPAILSAKSAKLLRPSDSCVENKGQLCEHVRVFSYLPPVKLEAGMAPIKNHELDVSRRIICLIQRSCPIYQHNPSKRSSFPCSGVLFQLQKKLGQY